LTVQKGVSLSRKATSTPGQEPTQTHLLPRLESRQQN